MPKIPEIPLKNIAELLEGELENDNGAIIGSIATSPEMSTENDIVFVYEQKFLKKIHEIKAKAYIFPSEIKNALPKISFPIIWVKRPRLVLKRILDFFAPKTFTPSGIHPSANIANSTTVDPTTSISANVFIGENSKIGKGTIIYPNVFIGGNVVIGENCKIYANVSIYDYSIIGNNVIIHSSTVIGSDGYSYVTDEESNLEKIRKGKTDINTGRQLQRKIISAGNVVIENDVEIGANTCIDRGTIGQTIIGEGSKIDNLVQIAHNCKIGKDCLIVGQVGFAGSVEIGDRVVVGGQVGFADNLKVGNDTVLVARAGIHNDIPDRSVYMGAPAIPYVDYFKNEKTLKRLPRKIEKLEEEIKLLKEKIQ